MKRRDFLKILTGSAAALTIGAEVDWEKLLWVPKPMVTVPALPTGECAWYFRVTDSPEFTFGFTGFHEGDDVSTIVPGHYGGQPRGQLLVKPRLTRMLYGVTD